MKIQCVVCDTDEGRLKQVRRLNSNEEFIICETCKRNYNLNRVLTIAIWQGHSWGAEMVR